MFTKRAIAMSIALVILTVVMMTNVDGAKRADSLPSRLADFTSQNVRALAKTVPGAESLWRGGGEDAGASEEDLSLWNAPTIPWSVGPREVGGEDDRARPVVMVEHAERCIGCGPLRFPFYKLEVFSKTEAFDFEIRQMTDSDGQKRHGEWRLSVFDPARKAWRTVASAENDLPPQEVSARLIRAMEEVGG